MKLWDAISGSTNIKVNSDLGWPQIAENVESSFVQWPKNDYAPLKLKSKDLYIYTHSRESIRMILGYPFSAFFAAEKGGCTLELSADSRGELADCARVSIAGRYTWVGTFQIAFGLMVVFGFGAWIGYQALTGGEVYLGQISVLAVLSAALYFFARFVILRRKQITTLAIPIMSEQLATVGIRVTAST